LYSKKLVYFFSIYNQKKKIKIKKIKIKKIKIKKIKIKIYIKYKIYI